MERSAEERYNNNNNNNNNRVNNNKHILDVDIHLRKLLCVYCLEIPE